MVGKPPPHLLKEELELGFSPGQVLVPGGSLDYCGRPGLQEGISI